MGYKFGLVIELDSTNTLIAFIGVILFVLFFDMLTELMEFFLEGSKLYHKMIQMIYKELMLMGLVSFSIIMINAIQAAQHITDPQLAEWLISIDYSHILLFFLTFFFVIHAFYLMRKAILCGKEYRKFSKYKAPALIAEINTTKKSAIANYFFHFQYLPFSNTRDHIEYYLLQSLFRDTYWLPEDFNFSDYLSNCFNRFALKTVNRSWITWVMLIIFALINYARVKLQLGFGDCASENSHATDDHSTDDHATDDHAATTDDHASTVHSFVFQGSIDGVKSGLPGNPLDMIIMAAARRLSTTTTSTKNISNACRLNSLKLFLFFAALLVIYTMIMVIVSRLYKIRMLHRIGLTSPDEYLEFLKFTVAEEEKAKNMKKINEVRRKAGLTVPPEVPKMTLSQLKEDIEKVLDADEHGGEGESEIREIAHFITSTWDWIRETGQIVTMVVRIVVRRGWSFLRNGGNADENGSLSSKDRSQSGKVAGDTGTSKKRMSVLGIGTPGALSKTSEKLNNESVKADIDSDEVSYMAHQHEKKQILDKLASGTPKKRKFSTAKAIASSPSTPTGDVAGLDAIKEEGASRSLHKGGFNSAAASQKGSEKSDEESGSLVSKKGASVTSSSAPPPSRSSFIFGGASAGADKAEKSISLRSRSAIQRLQELDLKDNAEKSVSLRNISSLRRSLDMTEGSLRNNPPRQNSATMNTNPKQNENPNSPIKPGGGNSQHHGIGHHEHGHIKESIQEVLDQHQQDLEGKARIFVSAGHEHGHIHGHGGGGSHSSVAASHHNPHNHNSVVIHAPEHAYTTVEKFLKKQTEEYYQSLENGGGGGGGGGFFSIRRVGSNEGKVSMRAPPKSVRRAGAVSGRIKPVTGPPRPLPPGPGGTTSGGDIEMGMVVAKGDDKRGAEGTKATATTIPVSTIGPNNKVVPINNKPPQIVAPPPQPDEEEEDDVRLDSDFSDIYFLNEPNHYYRAVELCILFNCLYLAFWTTDFIIIASHIIETDMWKWLDQLAMIVPVVIILPCIGYIAETCSILIAISELNLEVIRKCYMKFNDSDNSWVLPSDEVLNEVEDTNRIISDLRKKIMTRVAILESVEENKEQIIRELFEEIDQDGSGSIDKIEFRFLLRTLRLTYSDERFNRLFRAVDAGGEGSIEWEELYSLLFPNEEVPSPPPPVIPPPEEAAALPPTGPVGFLRKSFNNLMRSNSTDHPSVKQRQGSQSEGHHHVGDEKVTPSVRAAVLAISGGVAVGNSGVGHVPSTGNNKSRSDEDGRIARRSNSFDRHTAPSIPSSSDLGLRPHAHFGSFDFGDHGHGGIVVSGKMHAINVIEEEEEEISPTPHANNSTQRKLPVTSTSSDPKAISSHSIAVEAGGGAVSISPFSPTPSPSGGTSNLTNPQRIAETLKKIPEPLNDQVDVASPEPTDYMDVSTAVTAVQTLTSTTTAASAKEEPQLPILRAESKSSKRASIPDPAVSDSTAPGVDDALWSFIPGSNKVPSPSSGKSSKKVM